MLRGPSAMRLPRSNTTRHGRAGATGSAYRGAASVDVTLRPPMAPPLGTRRSTTPARPTLFRVRRVRRITVWEGCPSGTPLPADDQLSALAGEVGALSGVVGGRDGGVVRRRGISAAAEPTEQLGPGGVPGVVRRERQLVDD